MGWLDFVLATPVIGVHMIPNFEIITKYKSISAKLINKLVSENEFERLPVSKGWRLEIEDKKGYKYCFDSKDVTCDFSYIIEHEPIPGGFPIIKKQDLTNYFNLQENCYKKIMEMLSIIFNEGYSISIERIGFVMKSTLDPERLPPGIDKLYRYLSAPWQMGLIRYDTMLLGKLAEDDNIIERCHHYLKTDDVEQKENVSFSLDWQRVYKKPYEFEKIDDFERIASEALNKANKYFEEFGETGVNYG